tara:strand:+ start:6121 stop:6867 length:747 start_codon:yes stop_codon:yes gene_type:complete
MPIGLQIVPEPSDVADIAASVIAGLLRSTPSCVLGLSTGSSPIQTYDRLVEMHLEDGLSFSQARTFNLDEYVGFCGSHEQSYRAYMNRHLFDQIDIHIDRTHVPDGCADNLGVACDRFEALIAEAGGADLWFLGIGHNGHIAFNEPGSIPESRTRRISLAPETIEANSRFFDRAEDVPRHALTAGIGTILEGKRILLIATGESKAVAIRDALEGPITPACPASYLQTHDACTFVIDRAAASLLKNSQS